MRPWLRGLDLNQRPPGYEPDELPGCSTPQRHHNTQLRFFSKRRRARLSLSLPDELVGSSTPRVDVTRLGDLLRFPSARLAPEIPSDQRITCGLPVIQPEKSGQRNSSCPVKHEGRRYPGDFLGLRRASSLSQGEA